VRGWAPSAAGPTTLALVSGVTGPSVVLVGPPGAGKSTVGRLLAGRIGVEFTDIDDLIVTSAGRSISEIFITDGEPVFRELEETEVAAALVGCNGVLALGGGAVLSERTRIRLRGHSVVFLSVGMAEGVRRTGLSSARPLLAGVNPRATFAALLNARLPLYREVATLEVATDRRSPNEVAEDLLARSELWGVRAKPSCLDHGGAG
jgi:shikimate kinase